MSTKANVADVYKKTEVDTKLGTKANSADVYKKTEVDTKLGTKANSADVYTKTEVDKLINDLRTELGGGGQRKAVPLYLGEENRTFCYLK